ncbi:MAG: matrixin family metalloprotease [Microthrixaceae bacterium]
MDRDPSEDPFEQLLDPEFHKAPGPKELSAQERAANAKAKSEARRAREAALAERLSEEARLQREQDRRDSRDARVAKVSSARRFLPWAVVVVVIGGAAWMYTNQSLGGSDLSGGTALAPERRPEGYPPKDESASPDPLGTAPPSPADPGAYEFLFTQTDSTDPVAWDPCRPIRYVVNPQGAPEGAQVLLEDAIARTSAATGLQFEAVGTTDEVWSKQREPYQPERYGESWAPALIVWSNEQELAGLAGYIAGLGGPSVASDRDGTGVSVSGSVALDRDQLGEAIAMGQSDAARSVIQHELGHLVGLDHVADQAQLMYSEGGQQPLLDWGTGDLAGLNALGSQACHPDV